MIVVSMIMSTANMIYTRIAKNARKNALENIGKMTQRIFHLRISRALGRNRLV